MNNNQNKMIELDPTQRAIFEGIKNNPQQNYFIQGGAGTGKSTLINHIKEHLDRPIAVVAPTGIAAELIGGVTIHSLFKLGARPYFPLNVVARYQKYDEIVSVIETLIIDEVSMLRTDILDTINKLCQKAKKNNKIFGGIQVILVGDLYQLPPVYTNSKDAEAYMKTTYKEITPFFFDALCYKDAKFITKELTTSHRQDEKEFLDNLNIIRTGDQKALSKAIDYFNDCNDSDDDVSIVTTTRADAENKNNAELEKIPEELKTFQGQFKGKYYTDGTPQDIQKRKQEQIVPESLQLKKGAKVMLCKNDPTGRYVNGTMGKIKGFKTTSEQDIIVVTIKTANGEEDVEITTADWEVQEYILKNGTNKLSLETIGTYTQFPIKLAWAITIHKSQGQTWDGICIDLGTSGAFASGQVYVALSRVKRKNGIHLIEKIRDKDIMINPRITQFLKTGECPPPTVLDDITPDTRDNAQAFWEQYFPRIGEAKFNYATKGTNSNYRNAFWYTISNTQLEKTWYIIATDGAKKISKLFCVPGNTFKRSEFDIDWTVKRKWAIKKNAQFDICINDEESYKEMINKAVSFENYLIGIADYSHDKPEIKLFSDDKNE